MRSPSARPTAVEIPWPSGPVVVSIPGAWPYSGWPAHGEPSWRKFLMSSSETPYPVRCRIEYRSIDAWPAESTKRSRAGQSGCSGEWRMTRV